jgi:hypothetical protein
MNPLTFTGANFIKLPGTNWLKTDEDWIVDGDVNWAMADHLATGTYTHLIDAKSPLYEFYKQDAVIGTITFEVVGYDHVLHEDIHQVSYAKFFWRTDYTDIVAVDLDVSHAGGCSAVLTLR